MLAIFRGASSTLPLEHHAEAKPLFPVFGLGRLRRSRIVFIKCCVRRRPRRRDRWCVRDAIHVRSRRRSAPSWPADVQSGGGLRAGLSPGCARLRLCVQPSWRPDLRARVCQRCGLPGASRGPWTLAELRYATGHLRARASSRWWSWGRAGALAKPGMRGFELREPGPIVGAHEVA